MGKKSEYPEKTPDDGLQKMPHTKARKFKPQTHALALLAGLESRRANRYTTRRVAYLHINTSSSRLIII